MRDFTPEARLEAELVDEPWREPESLSITPDPEPFPLETALPPVLSWLREFTAATATALQVPVDLVSALTLPVFGVAVSGKIEVEPQPGWRETMALWSLVLLPSGERKSAALGVLVDPVRSWCRRRADAMRDVCARHAARVRIETAKMTRAEKDAAKDNADAVAASDQAQRFAVELAVLNAAAPRAPSLVASDATPQAVGLILARNNERALIASPEGAIVEVMLGRYADGKPELDMFLAAQAGDAIEIERVGRDSVRLSRPALSLALAVQPEAVRGLYASRAAAGKGLLARCLTVWPAPMVGSRQLRPDPVPKALSDRYEKAVHDLLDALPAEALSLDQIDAWHNEGRLPGVPLLLRPDPAADALLLAFRAEVERALRPDGAEAASLSWLSKLSGTVVRIAGVLHAVSYGIERGRPIDADAMRAAIEWGRYLWQHARRVGALAGEDEAATVAELVQRWIRRTGRTTFSRRDAFDACRGPACLVVDEIDPALELLVERGWTRRLPSPPPRATGGRPPSPRFEVNPALFARGRGESDAPGPQNPQNPHNGLHERNGSAGCAGSAGSPTDGGMDGPTGGHP